MSCSKSEEVIEVIEVNMDLESCIHLKEPATLYTEAATQEWLNSLNLLFMLKSKERLIAEAFPSNLLS
jgi:hypothetical protein